jgi:hypothetical protein
MITILNKAEENTIDEDEIMIYQVLSLESEFYLLKFCNEFLAQRKSLKTFYDDTILANSRFRNFIRSLLQDKTSIKKYVTKIPSWFSKNDKLVFSLISSWDIRDIQNFLRSYIDQFFDLFDFAILYFYNEHGFEQSQILKSFKINNHYFQLLRDTEKKNVDYNELMNKQLADFDLSKYRDQLQKEKDKDKLVIDKFYDLLKKTRKETNKANLHALLNFAKKETNDNDEKKVIDEILLWSNKDIRNFFNIFFKQQHGLKTFYDNFNNSDHEDDDDDENVNPIKLVFRKILQFPYKYKTLLDDAKAVVEMIDDDTVLDLLKQYPKDKLLRFTKLWIDSDNNSLSDFFYKFEADIKTYKPSHPRPSPKPPHTIIEVDYEKKEVPQKQINSPKIIPTGQFKAESLKTCLTFYKLYPWIPNINIRDVFIRPIKNIDESFYIQSDTYNHNGQIFYRPKEKYYMLQCYGINKHYKAQNANIEYITWNNVEYQVEIGIVSKDNFFTQNQDILKLEQHFIDNWLGKYDNIKQKIIDNLDIGNELFSTVTYMIKNSLMTILHNFDKYFSDRVISSMMNAFKNKSVTSKKFIRDTGFFLTFLQKNKYVIELPIFWKRLDLGMYKPEIFPFLTEKDMLPEIFDNTPQISGETVIEISKDLNEQQQIIENNIVTNTINFNIIPTRKYREHIEPANKIVIGLPSWKSLCFNSDDVANVDDEKLIFYTETKGPNKNNPFCFVIQELVKNFSQGNIVNPYSGLNFSNDFVQKILATYSIQNINFATDNDNTPTPIPPTPWLINLVLQELTKLENKFIPEYFEMISKKQKCSVCKNNIENNKINSLYKGKPIAFCSIDCFEAKNF